MARTKDDSKALIADLTSRLESLVAAARKEGRESALAEVRSLVSGAVVPVRRGPGRPRKDGSSPPAKPARAKSKKRRKNPWKDMTPEQKADRVRKMLAGRGLKPKGES